MVTDRETHVGFIYGLFDESNPGEIRYIGQTIAKISYRLRKHIHRAMNYRKFNDHNSSWIRKVIENSRKINILLIEKVDCFDWSTLDAREVFHIALFRKMGFNLTNSTDGGEGTRGRKIPDEQKLKMSISLKNNPNTIKNRVYAWFDTLTVEQICSVSDKQFCEFVLSFRPNWQPLKNANPERIIQHFYSYRAMYIRTKDQNTIDSFLKIVKAGIPCSEETKRKKSMILTGRPWSQKRRDAEKSKKQYSWRH